MLVIFAASVFLVWTGVLLWFGQDLLARWREPAFIQPIVIFESDDWGAGPIAQEKPLRDIVAILSQHTNAFGEHPVMTLGIILAALAGKHRACAATEDLPLLFLTDESMSAVLDAIREGNQRKVLSLQLHGFTHFNPAALTLAYKMNPQIALLLNSIEQPWTEQLPGALQSAWINGSSLPSTELAESEVHLIAQREGKLWKELFGVPPKIGVPTTFIWNEKVELAWAELGVQVLVTPGARYQSRDADGKPSGIDRKILNGQKGPSGLDYVVRNLYFEPSLGHSIDQLIKDITEQSRAYRPALIEIHRFNFCGPRAHPEALEILRTTVQRLSAVMPSARYMSTERLAEIMADGDSTLIATSPRVRLMAMFNRAREIPRLLKIARITGLALPLWIMQRIVAWV